MVEVLKQSQFQPMLVSEQVAIIYAVTNGHMDEVDQANVRDWEVGFYPFLKEKYPDVLANIERTRALADDTKATLATACEAYNKTFKAK